MSQGAEHLLVRLTLPDDIGMTHGDVYRLAALNRIRHVKQNAIAQVDGVAKADQSAGRAVSS